MRESERIMPEHAKDRRHLPPEALDDWLAAAASALGLDAEEVPIATVLQVAADVAHGVARPAAPLTAFLLGAAVARAGGSAAALEERAETIRALAERWEGRE